MSYSTNMWRVTEHCWEPSRELLSESIMSIANGYIGMRGNFEEDYSGRTHQGTYIGGVWFPDKTRVGWWKNGYPLYFGKMINAANLIGIHVRINGETLDLTKVAVWDFVREVDMQTGVFHRKVMLDMTDGTVALETWRFVSLKTHELLSIRYTLTPTFNARMEVEPYLDGNVRDEAANYDESFWDMQDGGSEDGVGFIQVRTKENTFGTPRFTVCAAQACKVQGLELVDEAAAHGYTIARYAGEIPADTTMVLDKMVYVVTDRDIPEDALRTSALQGVRMAAARGWEAELSDQADQWAERWKMADVQIDGDDGDQQGIRFNLFQMLSTYSGEDARLNIGPKGFTGEKYGGATYWDTEAYCLPVYMSVAGEHVAKQLLLYRYQQLPQAYENAKTLGLPGALFPMVTFTGIECHNEWEITFEEIHRNGAIAHAIYAYTVYTGDETYRTQEGLEVLLGIARFYAGRAHFSSRAGRYMIHGVTGPNEYENNVNNNWYTNRIAAWSIQYFLESLALAGDARREAVGVTQEELDRMKAVCEKMYLPEDETLGIFVQHDTFLDKELLPASEIPPEERPINQHWSWDHILRSCYIKQADVLQGLYFLEHLYSEDVIRRNYLFYEPMTVHESSLSPCVHAILAAHLGMHDKAVEMYKRTARLDLDNINHDTEDGLHITSMSGSWLTIVQGFAGMRTDHGLSLQPFLPECWTGYGFKLLYRGRLLRVRVDPGEVTVALEEGESMELTLNGKHFLLENVIHDALKT
ncbi:MAG: glycoside hydrolase family 65 protein [Clostridia bacterium]|nr:glycoside hydrolase family 65 protein [Clostridia bacterium]